MNSLQILILYRISENDHKKFVPHTHKNYAAVGNYFK